jgi:MFS family permease
MPDPTSGKVPGPRYTWYVVATLTALYTLSYMDRTILSILVGPIKRDLHVSDTMIGLLTGLAFAVFYTLIGLPMGRIADTRSRRGLITAGCVVWSIFTSACSASKGYWVLFATRIGVGVGESSLSPAAYSMIADLLPKEQLGLAISIYYMGVFFGTSLSQLVGGTTLDLLARTPVVTLPLLGAIASWRVVFLIVGLPGFLFALWAYSLREPVRRDLLRTSTGAASELNFAGALEQMRLRWQSLAGISLGMVFQSMCAFGYTFWAPSFFQRTYGWKPGQSGRALAAILLTFGCAGMFVGGKLSDRWQKSGVTDAPLKVAVMSAIGTAIFLPVAFLAGRAEWTLVFLAPGVFCNALPMGISVAALQRIFPNQVRGTVSALFLFILNLGGYPSGTLLPGVFNDYLFHDEKMLGASLALTVGGGAILMLVAFAVTCRPYREHYRLMHPAG